MLFEGTLFEGMQTSWLLLFYQRGPVSLRAWKRGQRTHDLVPSSCTSPYSVCPSVCLSVCLHSGTNTVSGKLGCLLNALYQKARSHRVIMLVLSAPWICWHCDSKVGVLTDCFINYQKNLRPSLSWVWLRHNSRKTHFGSNVYIYIYIYIYIHTYQYMSVS
jgi:hypothetical protein